MKNLKRSIAGLSAVCLLSLLLSSCLKSNSSYYNPPVALVSFFQASPDEPALDLYFNSNRVNWNPISYGSGLDYFNAFAGPRTVNFYAQNTMTKLFSDTLTLKPNAVYSLFLVNAASTPGIFVLNDTINRPANNTANIRFVDLSPDAPAVDLALNDSVKVSNKAYKGFSSFLPVAGNKTYSFKILQKGTSTVLASLSNVTLTNGYVYTIMLTGLSAGTTSADKLSVYYITNAQYF
ncbi:MAG TPA: DUF4397 domain-containing protein [Mucilaginibacter sp.]|jgi:hypothetical protein|nr:DUF4397 domain-containing protein [Mucilaginibacter sp.]